MSVLIQNVRVVNPFPSRHAQTSPGKKMNAKPDPINDRTQGDTEHTDAESRLNIDAIVLRYHADRTRLLDMLWDVQHHWGYIPPALLPYLADRLGTTALDIRETYSFYHFFLDQAPATHTIYLSDTVIARMQGFKEVADALEHATGCKFDDTEVKVATKVTEPATADDNESTAETIPQSGGRTNRHSGKNAVTFSLATTPCIGLSDQEPAMLIGNEVFTHLTAEKVTRIIRRLKQGETPEGILNPKQYPKESLAYVRSMVKSGIRHKGPVFFKTRINLANLLNHLTSMSPQDVIKIISDSGLRGRGGAGFATGTKWRLCAANEEQQRYIICNADEGEPGTFKDRVILMESPKDVIFGMIIGAWAIGAQEGIIYLRSEYAYLKAYLEAQLAECRRDGLLGRHIAQKFDFDIRIQLGAGAYVCGDETALMESMEGRRGTPRIKPPYPVNHGYLGKPTCANNVETLAAVTRILDQGADWFNSMGTAQSAGTRLLSISGDCDLPGIMEIEWGITLNEVLKKAGAHDAMAVQISGPSGELVAVASAGDRCISMEDLSCNGSMMIFNSTRNLLDIVTHFMQFFVHESCGICVPCRSGNIDLLHKMQRIDAGKAVQKDLDQVMQWGELVRKTSRCGLGATSPNPMLSLLNNFPELVQRHLQATQVQHDPHHDSHTGPHSGSLLQPSFDMAASRQGYLDAIATFSTITDRNTTP